MLSQALWNIFFCFIHKKVVSLHMLYFTKMKKIRFFTILVMVSIPLQETYSERVRPFSEMTLSSDGDWSIDVDFDGADEKVSVKDGNVFVFKGNKDVSKDMPYCLITAHECCSAHTAYTTFNYSDQSIYSEAHYGFADIKIRKIKKTENGWIDVAAIRPLSIINKVLYPKNHLQRIFLGSSCHWTWGNYHGGLHYWLS